MRKLIFIGLLVGISALLAACEAAATPAPSVSSKPVNITVDSNPSLAIAGDIENILTITDANGNPATKRAVGVVKAVRAPMAKAARVAKKAAA